MGTIFLKKGHDIKLNGSPKKQYFNNFTSSTYSVKPTDFIGIRPIPKLTVSEGDEILAGDQLFFDKPNPDVAFCSPVSGEVVEIKRGAKRAITEIVILADKKNKFKLYNPVELNYEALKGRLMESGCFAMFKQRPFNVVANPNIKPRDIFISCFDTNPLAVDYDFALAEEMEFFQAGVNILNYLTDGEVFTTVNKAKSIFRSTENSNVNIVSGPHPAGNVGVQIHHLKPINKGETVWTINPYDVVTIGKLFTNGVYDTKRSFTIGGPTLKNTGYFKNYLGVNIENIVQNNFLSDNIRCVSGSVLNGSTIPFNGNMGFFDSSLSVLEEGNFHELFGWLLPSYARPSINKTIPPIEFTFMPPFIKRVSKFDANTNTHGEKRAFVVSGEYEKVVPMDILPQHLLKAILSEDLDLMEGLGIYEVVEEDLALCEFVCTSKSEVQNILRKGLNLMIEQG